MYGYRGEALTIPGIMAGAVTGMLVSALIEKQWPGSPKWIRLFFATALGITVLVFVTTFLYEIFVACVALVGLYALIDWIKNSLKVAAPDITSKNSTNKNLSLSTHEEFGPNQANEIRIVSPQEERAPSRVIIFDREPITVTRTEQEPAAANPPQRSWQSIVAERFEEEPHYWSGRSSRTILNSDAGGVSVPQNAGVATIKQCPICRGQGVAESYAGFDSRGTATTSSTCKRCKGTGEYREPSDAETFDWNSN